MLRAVCLAVLGGACAVGARKPWDAVPQHVITDRPLLQVFPNGTFDPAVIPLLVQQARDIMPYVMHKAGIDDDKLPTFWLAADAKPRFALEQAVTRIAELDFPDGLAAADRTLFAPVASPYGQVTRSPA